MAGQIKEAFATSEHLRRAVAMMNVEINHGDALDLVYRSSVRSAHRDIIEQTKAHGFIYLGMVAGRPHSAKYSLCSIGHDCVDRHAQSAGSMQCRDTATWTDHSVRIQHPHAFDGNGGQQLFDILTIMDSCQLFNTGWRC